MSEKTIEGDLVHGLKIGEKTVTHFVLRPATTGDMIDAEEVAPSDRRITFQVALIARQLVRLDDVSGPFTVKVLRKLDPSDLRILMEAQDKLESAEDAREKK